MANPDNAASPDTFGDKVSTALTQSTRDDKGKLQFPEDTPQEVVYAATSEQRRRDTQAEYTRAKQQQAVLEAEKSELLKQVSSNVSFELTEDQRSELDAIKFSDTDLWRSKYNAYETEAKNKRAKEVNERLKEVSSEGTKAAELERRQKELDEFHSDNPGIVITDDIIASDIPPRITNKLKDNKITFKEFLQEVVDYLKAGKVVTKADEVLNQPNLSKAGGGSSPSEEAVSRESAQSYATEVY